MKNRPHILLVSSSSARRRLLANLLRKQLSSAEPRVFSSLALSRTPLEQNPPDILITDLESFEDASAMIHFLQDLPGSLGAIALIDDPPPGWMQAALHAGVNAFLSRNPDAEELQLGIAAAEARLILMHPSSAHNLAARDLPPAGPIHQPEHLTARESQVLRLISRGLGNKEIAACLDISAHTAKFHTSSILGKLGVASRTEAVSEGIKRGLIPI